MAKPRNRRASPPDSENEDRKHEKKIRQDTLSEVRREEKEWHTLLLSLDFSLMGSVYGNDWQTLVRNSLREQQMVVHGDLNIPAGDSFF